ncbi:MAG: phospholipase D-like domain-containing protein [Solirubrobacteraceae bacterium]
MKPRTSATGALLLAQAIVGVAVLAGAGGLRLAVIATFAAAGVLLTRQRSAQALAGGVLTAAAIAVIATGQASSQQLQAHRRSIARPATATSALQLITEPQAGIAPFLALIAAARHSVTLTMYELEDQAIEHVLAADAARGVNVRVLLNGGYYNERESTNQPAYNYLAAHDVHVRYSPAYFALTHQKTLTVDGDVAVIMTLNFDGAYSTTRDFAIIDRQPADVHAILATFNADYGGQQTTPSDGVGDLVWSPGAAGAALSLIDAAQRSIDLENEEMDYTPATDALCAAARRGVAVRIVMTYQSDWADALSKLSGCGARIRLYDGQGYSIHAKLLLVDGREALVGLQNLSTTSLDYNRELSIELTSAPLLGQLAAAFKSGYAGTTSPPQRARRRSQQ